MPERVDEPGSEAGKEGGPEGAERHDDDGKIPERKVVVSTARARDRPLPNP